jgi:hypothetical protein
MKKKLHHLQKYPWDVWLRKGSTHTIEYKKDFTCALVTMTAYLRNKASQYGRRVSIQTLGNTRLKFKVIG